MLKDEYRLIECESYTNNTNWKQPIIKALHLRRPNLTLKTFTVY